MEQIELVINIEPVNREYKIDNKGIAKFGILALMLGFFIFSFLILPQFTYSSPDEGESFPDTYVENAGGNSLSDVTANDGTYATQTENDANYMNVTFGDVIPSGAAVTSVFMIMEHWESDGDVDLEFWVLNNSIWYQVTTPAICSDGEGALCNYTFDLYAGSVDTESEVDNLNISFRCEQSAGGGDTCNVDYFLLNYTYIPAPFIEVDYASGSETNSTDCTEGSPCEHNQYTLFTVNSTVTCRNQACGTVSGQVRYNSSGSTMIPITKAQDSTPLFMQGKYKEILPTDQWNSDDNVTKVNISDNDYATETCGDNFCVTPSMYVNFTTSDIYDNVIVEWKVDDTDDIDTIKCWDGSGWSSILVTTVSTSNVNSSGSLSSCSNSDGNYTFQLYGTDGSANHHAKISVDFIFINTSGATNKQSCGSMSTDDTCQLNWTINGTSLGGYKIDANFSSSTVTENDTDDAIVKIVTGVDANPQFFDNSTNSTEVGDPIEFRLRWTDDTALSGYFLSFNNDSGTFTNDTWTRMEGIGNWSNVTKTVNFTTKANISWRWFANDSSNKWNSTGVYNLTTTCGCADYCILELPYTVDQDGATYCMKKDLQKSGETGITYGTSDTILDCDGNKLDGVVKDGGTYGFYLNGGDNNTIKNCNAEGYDIGIYITGGSDNYQILNNTFGTNLAGMSIGRNCDGGSIINNSFSGSFNPYALDFDGSKNVAFINNSFTGTKANVFIFNRAFSNISFIDNELKEIGGWGCKGCTIENNTMTALILNGNNNVTNNIISPGVRSYGIRLLGGSNNNITNNTIYGHTYNIQFEAGVGEISIGTVHGGTTYDYRLLSSASPLSYVRNTNFTDSRKINIYTDKWFNYNNETTGGIWVNTTVSATDTLTRILTNWNQTLMQWNDTGTKTAYYNISGLLASTEYYIYDNSVLVQTNTTDATGKLPQFSIDLSGEYEIKVTIAAPKHKFILKETAKFILKELGKFILKT